MIRPVIVGAAAAAIVVTAILLTFFIDRKPDDPVRKPSSWWEREAPAIGSPDRRATAAELARRPDGEAGKLPFHG